MPGVLIRPLPERKALHFTSKPSLRKVLGTPAWQEGWVEVSTAAVVDERLGESMTVVVAVVDERLGKSITVVVVDGSVSSGVLVATLEVVAVVEDANADVMGDIRLPLSIALPTA
jgi:hypothetical protein